MKSHLKKITLRGPGPYCSFHCMSHQYYGPAMSSARAGLELGSIMLASVGLATGTSMQLQKVHCSIQVYIWCPIVFTQELLIGVVHQQRITGFNLGKISLDQRLAMIHYEWFWFIIVVYCFISLEKEGFKILLGVQWTSQQKSYQC